MARDQGKLVARKSVGPVIASEAKQSGRGWLSGLLRRRTPRLGEEETRTFF